MEANIIPMSAWAQAVFVCLFIVFAVILFRLLSNQQEWYSEQQDKWQKFISARDIAWQDWMDRAESRTAARLEDVTEALGKVAEKLEAHDEKVISKLNEHDRRTDDRIDKIKEKTKQV